MYTNGGDLIHLIHFQNLNSVVSDSVIKAEMWNFPDVVVWQKWYWKHGKNGVFVVFCVKAYHYLNHNI